MEYFSPFRNIEYDNKTIKNITSRINVLRDVKKINTIFQSYIVRDGEKPEDIAFKYYGDASLFWVILLVNDIDDVYYGWHMQSEHFMDFVKKKYGVENVYSVHHYETTSASELGAGVIVNFGTPFSSPVSNYDYENILNEKKREIRILKKSYIQKLLQEVRNAY